MKKKARRRQRSKRLKFSMWLDKAQTSRPQSPLRRLQHLTAMTYPFKREKFEALALYIMKRHLGKRPLSLNTLGNLMWAVDSHHYQKHGRPITGAYYIKTDGGIFPEELFTIDLGHLFAFKTKVRRKTR